VGPIPANSPLLFNIEVVNIVPKIQPKAEEKATKDEAGEASSAPAF